jgi:hypothetical protein
MKTLEDYEYNYIERLGIITESGISEELAHAEAIYQVRADMVADGMGFGQANLMVIGIRKKVNKIN